MNARLETNMNRCGYFVIQGSEPLPIRSCSMTKIGRYHVGLLTNGTWNRTFSAWPKYFYGSNSKITESNCFAYLKGPQSMASETIDVRLNDDIIWYLLCKMMLCNENKMLIVTKKPFFMCSQSFDFIYLTKVGRTLLLIFTINFCVLHTKYYN